MIRLLYFAWVRVQIGLDERRPFGSPMTVEALVDWPPIWGRGDARALEQALRVAVNQVFAGRISFMRATVAVFPPVTGG